LSTIPASTIVSVTPSVISAGGTGLTGTGLVLTRNTRVPTGTVQSFGSAAAVAAYFGATDPLATTAAIYFAGFNGATILPSALLMAQFNQTAVAAYLRGGNVSGLSLAQLQAISGTLTMSVDGYSRAAGTVSLTAATSFSSAATIIQNALNAAAPNEASVTGSIAAGSSVFTGSVAGYVLTVTSVTSGSIVLGGALGGTGVAASTLITSQLSGSVGGIGTYAVSVPQTLASGTLNESYGTLTVTVVSSGTLSVGQAVSGSGVTASTVITALGTGAGGTGTYYVNNSQTVGSEALTTAATPVVVAYDSVSGGFTITSGVLGAASTVAFATGTGAGPMGLTSATGAVLSQGAAALTPAAFMTALVTTNLTWVNFMTHFDPDQGSGNTLKQAFAAWKNTAQGGNRFGYFCWDPDASPSTSNNATASLGQILKANGDSGTLLVWEGGATVDNGLCAFALGVAASINYQQVNGRADFAFRAQAGLTGNVTDPTTASNLLANGYSFYGVYGSAAANFIWFQNGQITGNFAWADSFETQVWLNSFFQQQFLTMLQNSLSVPFTPAGVSLIQQVAQTVIQAGLAFGAFAPNTLTPAQIAEVSAAAGGGSLGASVAAALQANGYYLLVTIPSQTVQAARGPWNIIFFYIDRNSVQTINLSSIMVQ
jgi:hypothetical protein